MISFRIYMEYLHQKKPEYYLNFLRTKEYKKVQENKDN